MPPITMLIKPVSGLCNMRCKYCFYSDVMHNRGVKSYGFMSYDTLETIVVKALEYADGLCSFAFQGGEPTLAGINFYKKLVEFQKKYNINNVEIVNSIQTNGYDMGVEFAKFLSKNNFLVGLSLDGTKDIHDDCRLGVNGEGTFDRVNKTAKLFNAQKVEYNILCVVNSSVASQPDRVYSNLKKYKFLQFIPCIDPFDGGNEYYSLSAQKYGRFLKGTFDRYYDDFMRGNYVSIRNFDNYVGMLMGRPPESCSMRGFCGCYFLIEGDGSTYPCDFYVLDRWKLGNVNSHSFEEMMSCGRAYDFVEVSRYMDEKCKSCRWVGLCNGGCRRDREPIVDGKLSINKYCEAYEMFFEYAYERMMKMVARIEKMH